MGWLRWLWNWGGSGDAPVYGLGCAHIAWTQPSTAVSWSGLSAVVAYTGPSAVVSWEVC